MIIRIAILIFSLLGTGLAVYLGKIDQPNRGYWYGAAVMGLNMSVFFVASVARFVFGTDWCYAIFPAYFANEWSVTMYLFISAYFLFFCLSSEKLNWDWLKKWSNK